MGYTGATIDPPVSMPTLFKKRATLKFSTLRSTSMSFLRLVRCQQPHALFQGFLIRFLLLSGVPVFLALHACFVCVRRVHYHVH